jgi:hypothetical protein
MSLIACRADLNSANALSIKPRFQPFKVTTKVNHTTENSTNKGRRLTTALQGLRGLTELLNSAATFPEANLEEICYGDKVHSVKRQLMQISQSQSHRNSIDKPSSLAGLIYVECCLRDVSPNRRIVRDLVIRLVGSLKEVENNALKLIDGAEVCYLIFWTLFLGSCAARSNTAERETLMNWLGPVTKRVVREPWTRLQESLKKISWLEREVHLEGALLWKEIKEKNIVHA